MKHCTVGLRILTVVAYFGITAGIAAAPTPRLGPVDLSGTLTEVHWEPEAKVAGKPGFSGSLGHDRVFPAHFVVTLADYDGVSSATANRLSELVGNRRGRVAGPDNISLMLPHDNKDFLKKGMRIRVRQYRISGDEGGTWSRCEKIEVLPATGP